MSIEQYNEKLVSAHCEKLEHLYLAAPCNEYFDPGVRISEGQAEIVIPIQEKFFRAAGSVHASIFFTAMADSALFAVNSIVENALVLTVSFNTDLTRPISAGELIARGRFLDKSDDRYLADSVLTDPEGREIGRGSGAFAESTIPLSPEIGYT
ncbi:PaaI family thioesterase [Planctomycetota bacterium]